MSLSLPAASARQLEWYRRERSAFFHFTVNTFTDLEWGDGTEDEAVFAPTALDCRQWIRAIKEAGFTTAILTAKHHDGFCLWPSRYTEHSIKNSPYQNGHGDIVREFTDACREFGIKAGLYLSPWDRNYKNWGKPEYNDYYDAQLTELLTQYGPIYEIWWDGAGSKEAVYDWKRWHDTVMRYQPDCVTFGGLGASPYIDVRWVGNEDGIAGDPCFASIDSASMLAENTAVLNSGDPNGDLFRPAECDTSIRPGWFYHPGENDKVKTAAELTEYWFTSIGRGCGILLNIPPNREGLLCPQDVAVLKEWNDRLNRAFAHDLSTQAKVTVTPDEVLAVFPEPVEINAYRIGEAVEEGERVRRYCVEAFADGRWVVLAEHQSLGFCRCEHFAPVQASAFRIRIQESAAAALLRDFALYRIPEDIFS